MIQHTHLKMVSSHRNLLTGFGSISETLRNLLTPVLLAAGSLRAAATKASPGTEDRWKEVSRSERKVSEVCGHANAGVRGRWERAGKISFKKWKMRGKFSVGNRRGDREENSGRENAISDMPCPSCIVDRYLHGPTSTLRHSCLVIMPEDNLSRRKIVPVYVWYSRLL